MTQQSTQIGAQMYTLREHTKTPVDIAKTCKRLKEMGFGAVQTSALGPIEASELRKILDDNGLEDAATHRKLEELEDIDSAVKYHETLGCKLPAIGGFNGKTKDEWKQFASRFNELGKKLNERGLRLGYHNHSHELAPFESDPAKLDPNDTPYKLLASELDPSIWFEVDVYWIAHGGGDPAQQLRDLKGRVPAIHVKDMTITQEREQKMCEVGAGNLNWPEIIKAAKESGTKWYLIERDRGDLDPFESLKISLENLKKMGLE